MRTRELLKAARTMGTDAGKAAASWVFDGNTTEAAYRTMLEGIDAGDPMVMDSVRLPDLSGECADDPTPQSLARELGIDDDDDRLDDACSAWEDGAQSAFWGEVERVARYHLA